VRYGAPQRWANLAAPSVQSNTRNAFLRDPGPLRLSPAQRLRTIAPELAATPTGIIVIVPWAHRRGGCREERLDHMHLPFSPLAAAAVASLLCACSAFDSVWSSLAGESGGSGRVIAIPTPQVQTSQPATGAATPTPSAAQPPAPTIATTAPPTPSIVPITAVAPVPATAASPPPAPFNTGTIANEHIRQLRGDLQRLRDSVAHSESALEQIRQAIGQDAQSYYASFGAIAARLQMGTTPGNAELVQHASAAQSALDRVAVDAARLPALAKDLTQYAGVATFLLESAKPLQMLPDAVEEDKRQLAQLDSDIRSTNSTIDKVSRAVAEETSRQNVYLANERQALANLSLAIKNGELYGQRLPGGGFAATPVAAKPAQAAVPAAGGERRPLVIIRFDRPNVPYEQALYGAVSRALERRPSAHFDVLAVATNSGGPTQQARNIDASERDAKAVLASLAAMGLPADRVTLEATTTAAVQSNEVHLYVR
jgi:hypothetical protein